MPTRSDTDVDPYHCETSHTPFHRWIRSAITGEAKFCFHCGVPATEVTD